MRYIRVGGGVPFHMPQCIWTVALLVTPLLLAMPADAANTRTTTFSTTVSTTRSTTVSRSPTLSVSPTFTFTPTLFSHNYSMVLSPQGYEAGQEVRGRLTTEFTTRNSGSAALFAHFNRSDEKAVSVMLFAYDAVLHDDCAGYVAQNVPISDLYTFGVAQPPMDDTLFVSSAYFTFVAPHQSIPFVICWKHTVPPELFTPGLVNEWHAFRDNGDTSTVFTYTSAPARTWYHLPQASVGQYAVLEVLSDDDSYNFSYAPSGCVSDLSLCGVGDNLKIVPKGSPCTYEFQQSNLPYLGSNLLSEAGIWEGPGILGLREGATPGGVGAFGTQYANPIVDEWVSGGNYAALPKGVNETKVHRTTYGVGGRLPRQSYVYVRLPEEIGSYDICFSARERRKEVARQNTTIAALPVWQKLPRCSPAIPYSCTQAPKGKQHFSFNTVPEEVGWSMTDLSPGTWGEIVFDDSGKGFLSHAPARSAVITLDTETSYHPKAATDVTNYWAPRGGDTFKIVEQKWFGEKAAVDPRGRASPHYVIPFGSFASQGCWTRARDVPSVDNGFHGGYLSRDTAYPIGSHHLAADPTDPKRRPTMGDKGQNTTFSTLYVPHNASQWYVCYRRSCNHETRGACAKHSGYRVLPFHKKMRGGVPTRWQHLEDHYVPGSLLAAGPAHLLVPYHYNEAGWGYPPLCGWYMNNTQAGSWGPILIEKVNSSRLTQLDSRPWNFMRKYSPRERTSWTNGSTVRLVPQNRPCDYPGFTGNVMSLEASSIDGGSVECNNNHSFENTPTCLGSAADHAATDIIAFYLTVPPAGTQYRVCYRLRGWNWREVLPSSVSRYDDVGALLGARNEPDHPMPHSILRRSSWQNPPDLLFTPTDSPLQALSLEYNEDASGMEALFIVRDTLSLLTAAPRGPCSAEEGAAGCDNSGDVLRIVPKGGQCDVNYRSWDASLGDTFLSLYCAESGGSGLVFGSGNVTTMCSRQGMTYQLCGGVPCVIGDPRITAWGETNPDPFDDMPPWDARHSDVPALAAHVVLPEYDEEEEEGNYYTLCYKRMASPNWVVFNDTFLVQKPKGYSLEEPDDDVALLSGSFQRFVLESEAVFPTQEIVLNGESRLTAVLDTFRAKLVYVVDSMQNNHCGNPAGSTEADALAGATQIQLVHDDDNKLEFFLDIPHRPGRYMLCVHIRQSSEGSLSWWRPHPYETHDFTVHDNGVRWYVTDGFEPTNQGLSEVHFLRCTPSDSGGCEMHANTEVFATDADEDGAKIVHNTSHCSDDSEHLGTEASSKGVNDLGPSDGPADVAVALIYLPATDADVRTTYKVCVKTHFLQSDGTREERWVEAQQAALQQTQSLILGVIQTPAFHTQQGLFRGWSLQDALRPANTFYSDTPNDTVVLAGASTRYVANPQTTGSTSVGNGFSLLTYSSVTDVLRQGLQFKLVPKELPQTERPVLGEEVQWGMVEEWEGSAASCLSEAAQGAENILACTASGVGVCADVSIASGATNIVDVVLQFPLRSAAYMVCVRVAHPTLPTPRPWLKLHSLWSDHRRIYTHPSFLEMEVLGQTLTAFDMRTISLASGLKHSGSSWCGGAGSNCVAEYSSSGFANDLVTVVDSSLVCPAPTLAPTGSAAGPPEWFVTTRYSNVSVQIKETWSNTANAFALPPLSAGASGQYKLCVYKASEQGPSASVLRRGVVYQLYNRGSTASGGGGGFWNDVSVVSAASLEVARTFAYNSSVHFTEYTSNLQASYGPAVLPDAFVTDPSTGQISRTPLLRSGQTVTFTVKLTTSLGKAFPHGDYPISIVRCPLTETWGGLECGSGWTWPGGGAPFAVQNVAGRCTAENAARYGWDAAGLRQFLSSGAAVFSVQYRSVCPGGVFGCGIRFVVDTPTGRIASPAQWVNVQQHTPDAVSVDGNYVASRTPGESGNSDGCAEEGLPCYLKTCYHGQPCTASIQARYNGPEEYAPLGKVAVLFSEQDYGLSYSASEPPPQVSELFNTSLGPQPRVAWGAWGAGGQISLTFIPQLSRGYAEGVAYFNVTYGTMWSRFALQVLKPVLRGVRFSEMYPLDTELQLTQDRIPTQAFTSQRLEGEEEYSLMAAEGSYLEALTPYRIHFVPLDAAGEAIPQLQDTLEDWVVSARVVGAVHSMVLSLPTEHASMYVTEPGALSQQMFFEELKYAGTDAFSLQFRIHLLDNSCSRFANDGAGCIVEFTFANKPRIVIAAFASPIRIPAATVAIEPATTVSTVREGIAVVVRPGTYVTWPDGGAFFVYDEFHIGDAFAMITGPPPTDGSTNRDRVVMVSDAANIAATPCAFVGQGACVAKYPMRLLGAETLMWGASWTMRPSVPCNKCHFTFHTTMGAGPESFTLNPDGSQRGTARLTWSGEDIELQCSSLLLLDAVGFPVGRVQSDSFALSVTAGVAGMAASAVYPRWWVYSDMQTDVNHTHGSTASYTIGQHGTTSSLLKMQMGDGARSHFPKLFVAGRAPDTGVTESFDIRFHTIGVLYDSAPNSLEGSTTYATKHFSCVSTVHMQSTAVAKSTAQTVIQLDLVSGATERCAGVTPCYEYETTVSTFAAGMDVMVKFFNTTSEQSILDTVARNVTIVPMGGPGTAPLGQAPAWTHQPLLKTYTSAHMKLDSVYNPAILDYLGGHTYTFGHLDAVATRPYASPGVGQLSLKYGSLENPTDPDRSPVRRAVFMVCDSAWVGGEERTGSMCLELSLWVRPDASMVHKVALWDTSPAGAYPRGYAAACAAKEMAVSAATYYTPVLVRTGYRYYVYNSPAKFSMAEVTHAQSFVAVTGEVASAVLEQTNGIPAGVGDNHTLLSASLHVTFRFTGLDLFTTPSKLEVSATYLSNGLGVTSAQSVGEYTWVDAVETLSHWEISDELQYDKECPTRRRLQSSQHHYRTYSTEVPGKGWRYADGAAVGQPFPIHTVVRNTDNQRATSFAAGTLVKVTKASWSGCNDGGTMSVYDLKPKPTLASALAYDAILTDSWVLGTDATAVSTNLGVAVVWPVFSAECEACVLRLDLCYPGRNVADCLQANPSSTEHSDVVPIYSDRSKLTKPFHVRRPSPDIVQVYNQFIPGQIAADPSMWDVRIGELFTIRTEEVTQYGDKWSVKEKTTGWTRQVWVRSVWAPSDVYNPVEMRYGNGGFLRDGTDSPATSGCEAAVTQAQFAGASSHPLLIPTLTGALTFYFTRPCSACFVFVDYVLTPPAGSTNEEPKFGSFALRTYTKFVPGAPQLFRVTTCGVEWFRTEAAPAVRRRRHFALTALWADKNHVISYEHSRDTVPFRMVQSLGNGGGGKVVITSPVSGTARVDSVEGSATVRVFLERSCYMCRLSFGQTHHLSVLTDATQLIANPRFPLKDTHRSFFDALETQQWQFEVYAADDLGDRAYTAGGPTALALHPRYQTQYPGKGVRAGDRVTLATEGSNFSPDIILTLGAETVVTKLNPKLPNVTIVAGEVVYNGIPMPGLEAKPGGVAVTTVQMAQYPGAGISLHMRLASNPRLRTSLHGGRGPPTLGFTTNATHFALDNAEIATGRSCKSVGMSQGMPPCVFRAYAVSNAPGDFDKSSWYQSLEMIPEPVVADVSCGVCGTAVLTPNQVHLKRGVAEFTLELIELFAGTATACSCQVTVMPPQTLLSRNATNQTFAVSFTPKLVAQWQWYNTSSFESVPTSGHATADSVFNRTVDIGLKAFDVTGAFSNLGGIVWEKGQLVTFVESSVAPLGCFTCFGRKVSGAGVVTCDVHLSSGDRIVVRGYFPYGGQCVISSGAFTEIPIGNAGVASPATGLTVNVQVPKTVVVVPDPAARTLAAHSNFSSLWGRTADGVEAAACGHGARLTFEVVDAAGKIVKGENHMRFTVKGARASGEQWVEQTLAARRGRVAFVLDVNDTTRSGCDVQGKCTHTPWSFEVVVVAVTHIGSALFQVVPDIRPLYFVRRASAFLALAQIAPPCGTMCPPPALGIDGLLSEYIQRGYAPLGLGGAGDVGRRAAQNGHRTEGRHGASWGVGMVFNMTLLAVDKLGTLVQHPEDSGSEGTVLFKALSVPCANVDRQNWVASTCMDRGGRCDLHTALKDMPKCSAEVSSQWNVEALTVSKGVAYFQNARYGRLEDTLETAARFFLTTNDLSYPWVNGWESHKSVPANRDSFAGPDRTFVYEMYMQVAHHLSPMQNASLCKHDTHNAVVTYVPFTLCSTPFFNTSRGRDSSV